MPQKNSHLDPWHSGIPPLSRTRTTPQRPYIFPPHPAKHPHTHLSQSIEEAKQWQNTLLLRSQAYVSQTRTCRRRANRLNKPAVAVGGTAGYLRTRSTPSLVAGIGLGASYALAGTSLPIWNSSDVAKTFPLKKKNLSPPPARKHLCDVPEVKSKCRS